LPIAAEIAAGEVWDDSGFDSLMETEGPEAKVLLAGRGYDSDHGRETLEEKGTATVIPTRRNQASNPGRWPYPPIAQPHRVLLQQAEELVTDRNPLR
jgi:hypothetical protein